MSACLAAWVAAEVTFYVYFRTQRLPPLLEPKHGLSEPEASGFGKDER